MNNRTSCRMVLMLSITCLMILAIPQANFAQTEKGVELYNSWQFEKAENVLREAFDADANDVRAGYFLGLSQLFQEKHKDALEVLTKVRAGLEKTGPGARPAVPAEIQVRIALARARLGLEQYKAAWEDLEAARKIDPNFTDVYVYRGVYYLKQEDNKKAVSELEKAMKLDQNHPYAHFHAGYAYLRTGHPQKAVDTWEQFLLLGPEMPEAATARVLIQALCQ
jgi:tetratricopeptide (TPR) repeat protein